MEKYSVLMAVYHKEKAEYLHLALESMLAQTIPPEEIVLVCDGPLTQELDAVIEQFCGTNEQTLHVVRLEKNMGLGVALNIGLQQCKNELVARMDSDDIALSDRMEKQLNAMEQNPNISVLGGQIAEFNEDPGKIVVYRTVPTETEAIREFIKYRNPMNHMTVIFRKSHVLAVGNYQDVPGFEDYFLWTSLIANGYSMGNLKEVCCRVRADEGLYSRRGGVRYFQNTMRVERFLLDKVIISPWQFVKNIAVRFVGTILLPPRLRKVMFLNFLRRQSLEAVMD